MWWEISYIQFSCQSYRVQALKLINHNYSTFGTATKCFVIFQLFAKDVSMSMDLCEPCKPNTVLSNYEESQLC